MNTKKVKYCIIIPAFQTAESLPSLIKKIQLIPISIKIIVVNDGSTDNTLDILGKFGDVIVVNHQINLGKGASIKSGIKKARELGFQYAICIDSDLQHPPELIPDFIKSQSETDVPLVLGFRQFSSEIMPLHRILSNTITSFVVSIRVGKRVHDSQCGYRLIDISNIDIDRFNENGFQFETELLLKIIPAGATFKEIPISTIYNKSNSSINNVKDTLKFIKLFLRSYLWS
ncbi:MAG: glycosyltransferase family 2 protein [Candidatus Helarchaeota archaeon]